MNRSRKLAVIAPPPERIEALKQYGSAIRWRARSAARSVLEIGRLLTEAKGLCKHGEWTAWLRDELGWEPRAAQLYMRVHESFKSENISLLKIDASALFLLSANETPAEVRAEAIRRAREEERITKAKVRAMMRKPKPLPLPPTQEEEDAQAREMVIDDLEFFVFRAVDEAYKDISEHFEELALSGSAWLPPEDFEGLDIRFTEGDADVLDVKTGMTLLVATLQKIPADRLEQVRARATASCERAAHILALMRILRERLTKGGSNGKVRSISASSDRGRGDQRGGI